MLESSLIEPTPSEIRFHIAGAPYPWREFFGYLLITGSRVSEAVSEELPSDSALTEKHRPSRNYGYLLSLKIEENPLGEAAVWTVSTAKRGGLQRAIAVPLDPKHEPLTKEVVELWEKEDDNPWRWNRQQALYMARKIFVDLGYWVEDQKIGDHQIQRHMKPVGNHAMRHFRTQELMLKYNFSDRDLMQFFGWTARNVGINPMIVRYANLQWQNYYPKLIKQY